MAVLSDGSFDVELNRKLHKPNLFGAMITFLCERLSVVQHPCGYAVSVVTFS